jgi:hypothetical protein
MQLLIRTLETADDPPVRVAWSKGEGLGRCANDIWVGTRCKGRAEGDASSKSGTMAAKTTARATSKTNILIRQSTPSLVPEVPLGGVRLAQRASSRPCGIAMCPLHEIPEFRFNPVLLGCV